MAEHNGKQIEGLPASQDLSQVPVSGLSLDPIDSMLSFALLLIIHHITKFPTLKTPTQAAHRKHWKPSICAAGAARVKEDAYRPRKLYALQRWWSAADASTGGLPRSDGAQIVLFLLGGEWRFPVAFGCW